ncbi:MAG: glycoside hydrolase family 95 protein [Eubacteriales bacterium]
MKKNMKLWYQQPGQEYLEGIAIGNGKLGATIFGGVESESTVLNEDSLWYGNFINRVNPDAKGFLDKLRSLVFDGKVWAAEKTAFLTMTATPDSERPYQPLGDLNLNFYYHQGNNKELGFLDDEFVQPANTVEYDKYTRELDLGTAICKTSFVVDGVAYEREAFASFPQQIMAFRFQASAANRISFTARLGRGRFRGVCNKVENHTVLLEGNLGDEGISYASGVTAVSKDGKISVMGQHLVVEKASEVILYVYGTTSFYEENVNDCVKKHLADARGFDYGTIKEEHIADYQEIFNRVSFALKNEELAAGEDFEALPTDVRLQNIKDHEDENMKDLGMQVLLYQYGRYLQIASSRAGSLPMNLRGIWNHEFCPPWDSKFTININQQMLYWPSDMCNMSECAIPMYDLIERMVPNGQKVAQEMYGCRGFVAHHNTDLWADCAPQDIHRAAFWSLGGAWLALHLWDTYDYNRDIEVLKKYYYVLTEAALFVLDFLVEDPDGYLVTCPSHSPENGYYLEHRQDIRPALTYGPTMDNMLIRYLFRRVVEASDILEKDKDFAGKVDKEFVAKLQTTMERLHSVKIGSHGQIMEWMKDYIEPEPGHRHMAHMFGLHPADDITKFTTPELAKAAEKSIDRRIAHQKPEDGKNGWTLSWMMLFEGRLQRAEKAYDYLQNMFRHAVAKNLFGLCVTEEIYVLDGNLGMTTAMTELVVQSQGQEISLLPSLPADWKEGSLSGIKARGGFEVSVSWKERELVEATICSLTDNTCKLRTKKPVVVLEKVMEENGVYTTIEVPVTEEDNLFGTRCISFACKAEGEYIIQE